MAQNLFKMLRLPAVLDINGDSRSGLFVKIKNDTFTPPVKIGPRASAWPDYEVNAINAARVSGKSKEEIRELVKKLHQARKGMAEKYRCIALGKSEEAA